MQYWKIQAVIWVYAISYWRRGISLLRSEHWGWRSSVIWSSHLSLWELSGISWRVFFLPPCETKSNHSTGLFLIRPMSSTLLSLQYWWRSRHSKGVIPESSNALKPVPGALVRCTGRWPIGCRERGEGRRLKFFLSRNWLQNVLGMSRSWPKPSVWL